jgi:SWI/SNF-related matrix-associated actin-dependent regulator 1 of chromatin subfamily A
MPVRVTVKENQFQVHLPEDLVREHDLQRVLRDTVSGIGRSRSTGVGILQAQRLEDFEDACRERGVSVEWGDEAGRLRGKAVEALDKANESEAESEGGGGWSTGERTGNKLGRCREELFTWQREAVNQAKRMAEKPWSQGVLLGASMGLGKSVMSIRFLVERSSFPVLCIAPASVKRHWREEWLAWTALPEDDVAVLDGMNPSMDPRLDDKLVVIANYAILGPRRESLGEWVQGGALVVDELHKVRNGDSQRGRHVNQLSGRVGMVLGLTGTPMLNHPKELRHPLKVLGALQGFGSGQGFNEMFTPVEMRQRRDGRTYPVYHAQNLDLLSSVLRATCLVRVRREEVLEDLPSVQRDAWRVPLTNRADYDAAMNDWEAWCDGGEAASTAEAIQQLSAARRLVGQGKVPFVVDAAETALQNDEQVVVFGHHRKDDNDVVPRVADKLDNKWGASLVTGDMTTTQRENQVEAFEHGDNNVLVATMGAAGQGVELTEATTMVFAELDYRPLIHAQCESRSFARLSNLHGLKSIYILAEDSVDEDFWAMLDRKQELFDRVIEGEDDGGFRVDDTVTASDVIRKVRQRRND